jgi:hypothetical protein
MFQHCYSHRHTTRTICLAACVLIFGLLVSPALSDANPFPTSYVWYCDDSGAVGWGQTGWAFPPQWEWMDAGPLNGTLPYYDLDPVNPYYACTGPLTADYSGYQFFAEIWLANNYVASANKVTAELRIGGWYNQGTFVAAASDTVVNPMPGQKYTFDFGTIPVMVLTNQALVVKIIYFGPAGDTHIYWDLTNYPSALRAEETIAVEEATWGAIKSLFGK